MPAVHVVMPSGVDDPLRPSGGNHYDRRLCDELVRLGWDVHEHLATGTWPTPAPSDTALFERLLGSIPDGAVVLVDGLIASGAEVLVEASHRLRLAVLVHMPDATEDVETAVLNAAAAVITTSAWSRDRIVETHGVPVERMWVAVPGVDPVPIGSGSPSGRNLLVVGPVSAAKAHDLLVAALADLADLDWTCTCVGSLDLDRDFVAALPDGGDRLRFTGALDRTTLDDLRAHSDVVVAPSRRESFGMAVAEALAAGIPVIASDVGGHGEALGQAANGSIPGAMIPGDDPGALANVLRRWLTDSELRHQWRTSAIARRDDLAGWADTARSVAAALFAISDDGAI